MSQKIRILLERADGVRQHYRVNRSYLKDIEKIRYSKTERRNIWKKSAKLKPKRQPRKRESKYLFLKVYAATHTGTRAQGNALEIDAHYFRTVLRDSGTATHIKKMRDYLDNEITEMFGNVPRELQPDEGAEIEETDSDTKPEAIINWRNNGGAWKRKDVTP